VNSLPAKQTIATGSQAVAFRPDGKVLATGGFQGSTVRLWNIATGKMSMEFGAGGGAINCLAYRPDGKAVATAENVGVRLWEASSGKQLRNWEVGQVWNLAFTPDGKTLAWYAGSKIILQPIDGE
jgi:WD40 repeat protein